MIPKQAIEKAIEGGWKGRFAGNTETGSNVQSLFAFKVTPQSDLDEVVRVINKGFNIYRVALDSAFWQALGKALGWKTGTLKGVQIDKWHAKALMFYDLILTGGDTKAFWDELLTKKLESL